MKKEFQFWHRRFRLSRVGFALIEILVGLAVFGLVMAAAGGAFYGIYKDWQRQKVYLQCIEDARWAIQLISNELRSIGSSFDSPEAYEAVGGGTSEKVYFWKGIENKKENNPHGDPNTLYRGEGNGFGVADGQAANPKNRVVLAKVAGLEVDCDKKGELCTITITTRPRPELDEGPGNRNYTIQTQIRARGG